VAPKPVEAPAPKPAPKAAPIFIPLARAGQVAPPSAKPALTPKEALAAKTKAHAAKSGAKPAPKPSESKAGFEASLVGASADDAVAACEKAGEAAAALVDAWATANNAAAIAEVAECEAVSGAARKAARRALNVLRSRGVAIPVRAKVEERPHEAEAEAQLTSPDTQGTFILTLTRREQSGRYHMAEIVLREPFGILRAWAGWLSLSQIKEGRNRQLEGYGIAPVSVPIAWARARVAAARKLNATSGQVLPLGLDRCIELLEPLPPSEPVHPAADLEGGITSERTSSATSASGLLHAEPEFRGWIAEPHALEELLYKLGERLGPEGIKDRAGFDAALTEEVAAATDRYFSPEARALLASRMRDAAVSVRARKGEAAATDVLAVARAVTEAGLITSPPREIPFLLQFFDLGLRAVAAQTGGQLRIPIPAGAQPPSESPQP
jgi:hypothetical protein